MKKFLSLIIVIMTTFSVLCIIPANAETLDTEKWFKSKNKNATYDEWNNIVQCKEVPYFGVAEPTDRICFINFSSYGEKLVDLEDESLFYSKIIKTYRTASDNKDFIITDYQDGVEIVRYKGKEKKLVIPSALDGKRVIKLGGYIKYQMPYDWSEEYEAEYYSAIEGTKVERLVIPKYVKEIAAGFFYKDCLVEYGENIKLKSIYVSKNNPYYTSVNRMLYNKNKSVLLYIPNKYQKATVKVLDGTKVVYNPIKSTTVNLKIPKSVRKISGISWRDLNNRYTGMCSKKLKSVKVAKKNTVYSSENGVLYDKKKTKLLIYPGGKKNKEFVAPNSVKSFPRICIDDFPNLKTITFGKKIKSIKLYGDFDYDRLTIRGYKGTEAEKFVKRVYREYKR